MALQLPAVKPCGGGLLTQLRRPKPVETVEVTFTGHPLAVAAVARALAAITIVDSMRHQPAGWDDRITVEAVCRPIHRIRVPK